MRRPILRYGDPLLHQPASRVSEITPEIETLLEDMRDTMHGAAGVGLAAPQVGVSLQICVVDLSAGKRPDQVMVLINPEVLACDGMQLKEEGCLSLPGIEATVARPTHLTVRAMDRDGHDREIQAKGLLARVLHHEIDHLRGVLFLDRLVPVYRWTLKRRIARLKRAGKW